MSIDFTQPSWEADRFPGRHTARVGAQAGARELGASVYELDPGAVGSPLHIHHANEELLLVLDGTVSLHGPNGTQLLRAGAVVVFPRGKTGAHSLVNRSDAPVRYLVVSTRRRPVTSRNLGSDMKPSNRSAWPTAAPVTRTLA